MYTIEQKKRYIEFLKEEISKRNYPPTFNGDMEYYNSYNYLFNCYAYAMQFGLNSRILDEYNNSESRLYYASYSPIVFTPGFVKRENIYIKSKEMLTDYFLEDCDALGISAKESTIASMPKEDSYKIVIYLRKKFEYSVGEKYRDFHFFRQNDDGTWSDKLGYNNEVSKVTDMDEEMRGHGVTQIGVYELSRKLK